LTLPLDLVFNKPLLIRQFELSQKSDTSLNIAGETYQKSLNCLDKAIALDSEFVLAWANRSFPAYYLQQYELALDSSDQALALDPDNQKAMNEVVHCNRGCILLRLNEINEALQAFNAALAIDSKLSEAWIGQGTALFHLDRYAEAMESFVQADQLNHPLAQVNLTLAQQHLA
jgi:tetratricopeptide (TPR) repeat protein